ncbi:hypothetical protein MACK_001112 [Theileria orientalis]|uniref:Uncharacterized protein n=1 Tax=Theileria orientalis TaxID=68886 RepID=A0A976MCF9_THEOR|nr:hypothetical protein MACK_001112 [Theileria orientalis]
MRYKVIFSGLSCMAYLSIIFQKLFYKSKTKRLRSSSKTAIDCEANEQGQSHTAGNTSDGRSEVITSNSDGEKINHSETSDPHTPRNRGTPSITDSNPYAPTKSSDKLTSTGQIGTNGQLGLAEPKIRVDQNVRQTFKNRYQGL